MFVVLQASSSLLVSFICSKNFKCSKTVSCCCSSEEYSMTLAVKATINNYHIIKKTFFKTVPTDCFAYEAI